VVPTASGSLNFTVILLATGNLVAKLAGEVLTTVGAVFAPVVKLKVYAVANPNPWLSFIAPAGIVTVYFVFPIKLLFGFIIKLSKLTAFCTATTTPLGFFTIILP